MSVHVTSIIWRHYPSRAELLTALALADIADDRGYCIYADTSIEAIAIKTLQSPRAVQYHLQAMKQIGWLVVVGNEAGGRGHVTQYRIPVELVPLGGGAQRVQDLRPYENRQVAADADAQDVVVSDGERVQKMHSLSESGGKGAIPDTKGASFDAKGCKNQQPPNVGYVVRKNTSAAPAVADALFERFWTAYPRKTAKAVARKKFLQMKVDDALLQTMLLSIAAHKGTDQWKRNIIPHAATWLNQRRWEDAVGGVDAPVVRKLCTEHVGDGKQCGMPGTQHGSEVLCEGHYQKRVGLREMPADVRERLGLNGRKRVPA